MRIHDAFKSRMVAQVRQIQKYKKILEQQGRRLSIEEAAMEWISRYAADFPTLSAR
jgi:hypothetical protein